MFIYKCDICGKTYERDSVRYLCPECSKEYIPENPLKGVLKVQFDYDYIKKSFDFKNPNWNLFSAVEEKYYPDYPVGNTPFFKTRNLGEDVWIKNDGLNPSGSLKDRASFLVVAEANRLGIDTIVTASTGNAASALASVCAAANKKAVIFVPESAPKAKLVQMILYGAKVIPVKGTYDDAFKLSLEYSEKYSGLNRNTAYHPLTIEGKKTVGLEMFSQNNFKSPDVIFIPVGDGVIISGVYKAFYDLKMSGMVEKIPKLICVQAENSSAIHNFIVSGKYKNLESSKTIADSISVSAPSNAFMSRNAVIDSNGFSVTVSDEEIMTAQKSLANKTGIFAEPASSAAYAGYIKSKNKIGINKQVVLLITGHGLKDIEAPLSRIKIPEAIFPDINNVKAY
jgi:threonine synthase